MSFISAFERALIGAVLKTHRLIAVSFTSCYFLDLTDKTSVFDSPRGVSVDQHRAKLKSFLAWLSNKDTGSSSGMFALFLSWSHIV